LEAEVCVLLDMFSLLLTILRVELRMRLIADSYYYLCLKSCYLLIKRFSYMV